MPQPAPRSEKARRAVKKAGKVALAAALGAFVRWAVTWLLGRVT